MQLDPVVIIREHIQPEFLLNILPTQLILDINSPTQIFLIGLNQALSMINLSNFPNQTVKTIALNNTLNLRQSIGKQKDIIFKLLRSNILCSLI